MIICVDFDGTITDQPEYVPPEEMTLKRDCKEVLTWMHWLGIKLILYTCRSGHAMDEAEQFLMDNSLFIFDAVNSQLPEIEEKYFPDVSPKPGADLYIDDKTIHGRVNWKEVQQYVRANLIRR